MTRAMDPPPREDTLPPETARWLVTAEGLALVRRAEVALGEGNGPLELASLLRHDGLDPGQVRAVASVADARRRMTPELRAAGFVATRGMLEQMSDPTVSAWRARRVRGHVIDLCCGAGGDTVALATHAERVTSVEIHEDRAVLTAHNARTRDVRVVVGDALQAPVRLDGVVHVDPSRRTSRGRARRLEEYVPPVDALLAACSQARGLAVVLSPAVDIDEPLLQSGEIEFIQVGRRLVEAVWWSAALRDGPVMARASILPQGETRTRERDVDPLPSGPVGAWLVEVVPAAVRARLHDTLGAEIGARRLATRRALMTTDEKPPVSPWWRALRVEAVLPPRARHVRTWLAGADNLPLEIHLHGLDVHLDRFWRDLGRPHRGPEGREIHLARLDEGAVAIICRR
jgi:hypothetical protein